jgi:hypothetical protein
VSRSSRSGFDRQFVLESSNVLEDQLLIPRGQAPWSRRAAAVTKLGTSQLHEAAMDTKRSSQAIIRREFVRCSFQDFNQKCLFVIDGPRVLTQSRF